MFIANLSNSILSPLFLEQPEVEVERSVGIELFELEPVERELELEPSFMVEAVEPIPNHRFLFPKFTK